jgi:hypothetical protein
MQVIPARIVSEQCAVHAVGEVFEEGHFAHGGEGIIVSRWAWGPWQDHRVVILTLLAF